MNGIRNIICAILLLINMLLLLNYYICNKNIKQERRLCNNKIDALFYESTLLRENLLLSIQDVCILPEKTIVYTESGDSTTLDKIKQNKKSLILRYSYLSCQPCVDNIIANIKQFVEENDTLEVLLLSNYQCKKDLRNFKRINTIFTEVYNIKHLDISLEKENVPYMFIIDENMNIFNFFIPRKEIPELTKQYLQRVKRIINQ